MIIHRHDELRKFARMDIDTAISYTIEGSGPESYSGLSGDISATGLSMKTNKLLTEGDVIKLTIDPTGSTLPPFEAEGSVLRVSTDENDRNLFHISVTLTHIT
ncbi:MAG: hypothetical protein COA90_04780 [Gammaproteobacteria bacterium]|nr:MAG: hypothetical protein COA90_04780 [Gammaproteobacteria bacterium]